VFRFLLKPRWLILTALVLVLVVVMINLALWQVRRLDERRDRNALIEARQVEQPIAVEQLLRVDEPIADARREAEWRTVEATGTYDAAAEVLIRNRSLDSAPGYHVVTPVVLPDGTALLVNRGWIPIGDQPGVAPAVAPPPTGQVTVIGRTRGSQERGAIGPTDPADGTLAQLARVDVARIDQQVPYRLLPAYVELIDQQPAPSQPLPRLLPPPELDDGPHFAYAVQWCIFTVLAVVGWVVLVRRQVLQDRRRGGPPQPSEQAPAAPARPV
jgi:cytochrome oxidase assembly protein ShyY1